jgi:addiction module RelE/StbE family toxin
VSVRWSAQARRDLAGIGLYVSQDSPQAAERLVIRIREAVGILAEQPLIGRQGQRVDVRELVISRTPYLALYRARKSARKIEVVVLRVVHASRDRSNLT